MVSKFLVGKNKINLFCLRYVVYKLPLQPNPNSLIAQGAAYAYITSTGTGSWTLSTVSVNDTNSIIGLTLQPLFTNVSYEYTSTV